MKLIVTENYEEMSQQATEIIIKTFQSQPNGLYCFAGGDTPVKTLQLLCKAYEDQLSVMTQDY